MLYCTPSYPRRLLALALGLVISGPSAAEPANEAKPLPLEQLSAFTEAFARIKSAYVNDISDKELLEAAIAGMVGSLDPHSSYLAGEALSDLQSSTTGEYGGLGIEIAQDKGFIRIISPMDDTPASRAGIMAGDMIIKINDTALAGDNLAEAIERMRGEIGESVKLTLLREGQPKPFDVTLKREQIKVTSVRSRVLEPGYGYVRISQFQVRTGNDLRTAIAKLSKENATPLRGLVLDLRNNPGGVLQAAIDVSDTFITEGGIVSTHGRVPEASYSSSAKPDDLLKGAPMVVLINSGSASASEIVAGALQDHKRATVMGTRSFGKGSVQTVLPLSGDGAIKLTTALYYTPSGRSIQATGIVPDIEVAQSKAEDKADDGVHESDLPHRLANGNDASAKAQPAKAKTRLVPPSNPAKGSDFQLSSALRQLKNGTQLGLNEPKP